MIRSAVLAVVILAALVTSAQAIDPECDPGDPAFLERFDPATGALIAPMRRVRFCSSLAPANHAWTGSLTCVLSLAEVPFFQTVVAPGSLVTADLLEADAGAAELVCTAPARDPDGNATTISSAPTLFAYEPVPVLEPSVPLEDSPPSQP